MTNREVADIFDDIYNRFWLKWRDRVIADTPLQWDDLLAEAEAIMEKYGTHMVRKWEGPVPEMVEEHKVSPLVLWLIDELENRAGRKTDEA